MKKIITLVMCTVLLVSFAACSGGESTDPKAGDTMNLSEIFESILLDVDNLPEVKETEITDDTYRYYLFIDPIEGAEALACDSLINAVPHSAVLLRVPESTDAASVAKEIEQNADPKKWICVGAEKTIVSVHEKTILLVMSYAETADKIAANFDELWA